MLLEGECEGLVPPRPPTSTASPDNVIINCSTSSKIEELWPSRPRRGPKTNYVRTDEVERQVIRHRFLDPDASADIIAQKLRQAGFEISTRSVERVIETYGLQKKTLSLPPGL